MSDTVTLSARRFTDLVGCRLPIQQAGMGGGVCTPALAAAVAGAGALGMLGAAGVGGEDLTAQLAAARASSEDAVVGVHFPMPSLDRDAFDAAADLAPLVECFYGVPDPELVDRAHSLDALVSWQVGDL